MSDLFNRVADELITDEQYLPLPDYDKGVKDCRDGVPHAEGKGMEYDYGYSIQYAREARETARSTGK